MQLRVNYIYIVAPFLFLSSCTLFTKNGGSDVQLETFENEKAIKYAETITKEDLNKHLSVLASDEYEGRETGKKGQKMAAEYIYKQFQGDNLIGPVKDSKNPYLQSFLLSESAVKSFQLKANGAKLKLFEDFA